MRRKGFVSHVSRILTPNDDVIQKLTQIEEHVEYRKDRNCALNTLNIILPIDYIVVNDINTQKHIFEWRKMPGEIWQLLILLTGLALTYIPIYASAKYNLVGRNNEVDAMKVAVEKDILGIFRPIRNRIRRVWFKFKLNLELYFWTFIICILCSRWGTTASSQAVNHSHW